MSTETTKAPLTADVCIVGAGMIGASAAKYLAGKAGGKSVVLIGPSHNRDADGARAAHHDVARITRVVDSNKAWATLANESIGRYRAIADESGIEFHCKTGVVYVADAEQATKVEDALAQVVSTAPPVTRVTTAAAVATEFPCLDLQWCEQQTSGRVGGNATDFYIERGDAGVINPSALVAAQLRIATRRGATIITDVVSSVERYADDGSGIKYKCVAREHVILCKQLLICAGAFTGFKKLLPIALAIRNVAEGTALLRLESVSNDDAIMKMPAVLNKSGETLERFYMLPPTWYDHTVADGSFVANRNWQPGYYVKLGPSGDSMCFDIHDGEAARRWADKDDTRPAWDQALAALIRRTLPQVRFSPTLNTIQCIYDITSTGLPFVGCVDGEDWYCATGGNGRAAKSCDEIGRLAADVVIRRLKEATVAGVSLRPMVASRL